MKEDKNVILVTVRAKQLKHCTKAELASDAPILVDEKGVKYKQLINDIKPVGNDKQ